MLILSFFTTIVAVGALSPCGSTTSHKLADVGYLGRGVDPLLISTNAINQNEYREPVFNLSYSQNRTTPDGRWVIPDGTTALQAPGCEFDALVEELTSGFDFSVSVNQDFGFKVGFLWFIRAVLSENFQFFTEVTAKSGFHLFTAHAKCSAYNLQFVDWSTAALTSDFLASVAALPAGPSGLSSYLDFLQRFGSEVGIGVNMGGKAYQFVGTQAVKYWEMEKSSISVSEQASAWFFVFAKESASIHINQKELTTFQSNSQLIGHGFVGGCQRNNSFTEWATTVASQPVPLHTDLVRIASLFTTTNFPNDPEIAKKRELLILAELIRGLEAVGHMIPLQYAADATSKGVAGHETLLHHPNASTTHSNIPYMVQPSFTADPHRNTTTAFYLLGNYGEGLNPSLVSADSSKASLSVRSPNELFKYYDASTGKWFGTYTGFWTLTSIFHQPSVSSGWIKAEYSTTPNTITLLKDKINEDTAFMQIWFATESDPLVGYPLLCRSVSSQQVNPTQIFISGGSIGIGMKGSTKTNYPVFTAATADGKYTNYLYGYFRAVVYQKPEKISSQDFYDSRWVNCSAEGPCVFNHHLQTTPDMVQVYFSPTGTMESSYPIVWGQPGQTSNPATISVNPHNVVLNMIKLPNGIYNGWSSPGGWNVVYKTGYWRVVALRSMLTYSNYSDVQPSESPVPKQTVKVGMTQMHLGNNSPQQVQGAPPRLPNSGYLGHGIDSSMLSMSADLIDAYQSKVFKVAYTMKSTTPDGRWMIPDNTNVLINNRCDFDAKTRELHNGYDYQLMVDETITRKHGFLWWSSTHSKHYSFFENIMRQSSSYLYTSHSDCENYRIEFNDWNLNTKIELEATFVKAVQALPVSVLHLSQYYDFLKIYGDHVAVGMSMGGRSYQTVSMTSQKYSLFKKGNFDAIKQSKLGFYLFVKEGYAVYIDKHKNEEWAKNTSLIEHGFIGGTPVENNSFSAWSESLFNNPVPVKTQIIPIWDLFNHKFFPTDSKILEKYLLLKFAIRKYHLASRNPVTNQQQNAPLNYVADTVLAILPDHVTTLYHPNSTSSNTGVLPTLMQVYFTPSPYRTTGTSSFYLTNLCTTCNPDTISTTTTQVTLAVSSHMKDSTLYDTYNSATEGWTSYNTGYWVLASTKAVPSNDSGWLNTTKSTDKTWLPLLQKGAITEDTLFIQVWYAEESDPMKAYPLAVRTSNYSSSGNNPQPNPLIVALDDGALSMGMSATKSSSGQDQNVFDYFEVGVGNLVEMYGFWRAVTFDRSVFDTKPAEADLYDSGWVKCGAEGPCTFTHSLGVVPDIVQGYFSETGSMLSAYPLTFGMHGETGNPPELSFDSHNVVIQMEPGSPSVVYNVWDPKNGWRKVSNGMWRVVALRSVNLLNPPSKHGF